MKNKRRDQEDLYIKILRRFRENGFNGTTDSEIFELAKQEGYLSDDEFKAYIDKSITNISGDGKYKIGIIGHYIGDIRKTTSSLRGKPVNILSKDSYFDLLEYDELKLAREQANSARKYSTWAIIISLFAALSSIIIGLLQLSQ